MSEEPTQSALDVPTEATAEHIIFTLQPGATSGDPKQAIVQILRRYLADVQSQEFEDALRAEDLEERN